MSFQSVMDLKATAESIGKNKTIDDLEVELEVIIQAAANLGQNCVEHDFGVGVDTALVSKVAIQLAGLGYKVLITPENHRKLEVEW